MQIDWLADVLRAAGLDVVEYDGWKTRTARSFDSYTPVGIINHHTAGYYYLQNYPEGHWPDSSLSYKCNITIRPNGEVHVLNAGWAYDSGMGSSKVLDAVRNDQPLPSLGPLTSDIGGNRWFIDAEVQHLGDGGPIEPVQREALIKANAAICGRMGWDPRYRVIGHREWAPDRKVDPRWDGVANPMPAIREDTLDLMEDEMPAPKDWDSDDRKVVFNTVMERFPIRDKDGNLVSIHDAIEEVYRTTRWTKAKLAALAGGSFGAGAVADELARRLLG